jgi:acetoin utilization deacetylase AcuC-like enzyme
VSTGYIWHERYAWHDAGRASLDPVVETYPAFDLPETKRRLHSLIEFSGLAEKLVRISARPASEAELLRVHTASYLKRIRDLSQAGADMPANQTRSLGQTALTLHASPRVAALRRSKRSSSVE